MLRESLRLSEPLFSDQKWKQEYPWHVPHQAAERSKANKNTSESSSQSTKPYVSVSCGDCLVVAAAVVIVSALIETVL